MFDSPDSLLAAKYELMHRMLELVKVLPSSAMDAAVTSMFDTLIERVPEHADAIRGLKNDAIRLVMGPKDVPVAVSPFAQAIRGVEA